MSVAASCLNFTTTSSATPAARSGSALLRSWPPALPTGSATDRARRSAFHAFGALAIAAVALIVSQLAIGHAGGYPGFTNGLSVVLFMPAALGMLIAPQVALVAGTLAALRAVRRRRARVLPAAEIALIRRRAWVGLGAGFATVAGLELYVVDSSSVLPAWWLALVGGLAAVAGVTLLGASRTLAGAEAVVSGTSGQAGDISEDLPLTGWQWLRRRPWRLGMIASLTVAVVMTVFQAHAEHSLIEGIQRGVFEGLAAAAGFALLGGAVGVRPPSLRIRERAPRRTSPLRGSRMSVRGSPSARRTSSWQTRTAPAPSWFCVRTSATGG